MSSSKPKLQILTRGCSKNRVDTEHLLAQISDSYDIYPEGELQDTYVDTVLVNTCGFIGDAKEESINTILEVVKRKNEGLVGKMPFPALFLRTSGSDSRGGPLAGSKG